MRLGIVVVLLCFIQAQGITLRVPEEYPTIQSALDSTSSWDTVSVAPGTYNEFLVGPNHSFVLSGRFPVDTTTLLRALLDPIPPANADTPSVFTIMRDTAEISNFAFFNRPEMRQPDGATRSGGIENRASLLKLSHCNFDSVSAAVRGGNNIVIEHCIFIGCDGACVQPNGGRLIATNCYFEGGGSEMVYAYSGSRFEDCVFACNNVGGHFLDIGGSNILISRCRFGPCVGSFWVIDIYPITNIVIEDCLFEGLDRVYSVIAVGANCSITHGVPITIRGNTFRDNHNVDPASGVLAMTMQCASGSHGFLGVIENNIFADGSSNVLTAGIHSLNSSLEIRNNVFEDLSPQTYPDILAEGSSQDTILARNNSFLPPGLAARRTSPHFDARENWWGDSTGPYNPSVNPEGQGSEVGNGVLFVPWLTQHPDSIDSTEVAIENPNVLLPSAYSLTAFPNPFNATTTLSVEVAHAGNYDVILYDVTGREAAKLYAGTITSQKSVRVNAELFASGVYFAELKSDKGVLATTKLLLLK